MRTYSITVGARDVGSQVIELLTHDATVQETLVDAEIEDADAIISTTDEDATNIMVMLLAKEFEVPSLGRPALSAD